MQINVSVTDANNIVCNVVPPQTQVITIDRGVAGNGIVSIVPVTISTFQYLRITYTNGTVQDVGPLTSTAYTATAPITIVGNTISLSTVPIASGGTGATTAATAIQNLLPSYTGNANKRLGLNSGGTALEWVLDGGGTVTSVAASGGTTGLTFTGSPITTSGTLTLGGTLAVASGGTGVTTSTGTGSVVLSTSPTLVTPLLGTPTSGNFSTGTFTWPTFNQNTTGTAANITATSNSTLTTLSALSLPGSQVTGNISGNAANVTGTVAIANGGTGQTTANAALNALLPTQTGNASKYLQTDGTNSSWDAISLSTADITGTLGIANGGTGQITANAAFNALAPSQTGQSGKYLTTDGTNTSWATNPLGTVTSVGGTGTVSGITLSGTVTTSGNLTLGGALDLSAFNGAGAFTTLSASSTVTLSGGTANGVTYLNGSKVLTSGSALTFDGTSLATPNFITTTDASGLATFGRFSSGYTWSLIRPSTTATGIEFRTFAGDALYQLDQSSGANKHIWYTGASEQMRLTSTGLGIGTSSPAYKLDVQGTIRTTDGTNYSLFANNFLRSYATGTFYFDNSTVGQSFVYRTSSASALDTTALTLTSSGNLGLGVTPSAWSGAKAFQVNSAGFPAFIADVGGDAWFGYNSYYNGTNWIYRGSYFATAIQQTSGIFKFLTAPSGTAGTAITFTQAMTLDASGNLAVGQTTASSRLHINGESRFTDGTSTVKIINSSAIGFFGTLSNHPLAFITNDTERARIDSSGSLLVGTTSNSAYTAKAVFSASTQSNLVVTTSGAAWGIIDNQTNAGTQYFARFDYNNSLIGSIQGSNTLTTYNSTSDYRLKNVIGLVTGSGERIDALEPIEYEWKETGTRTRGFLAHKFQEVYPQSVTGDKDAVDAEGNPVYQAMQASTAEVIADLVAEIQSLRKRLADAGL